MRGQLSSDSGSPCRVLDTEGDRRAPASFRGRGFGRTVLRLVNANPTRYLIFAPSPLWSEPGFTGCDHNPDL